jgi:flagellar biosynthetic protein FlhB
MNSLHTFEMNTQLFITYAYQGMLFIALLLAPFFIGLTIIATAVGYGQVGFKITPKALKPELSKINPLKGIKNQLFSSRSVVEMVKASLKLILMALLSYWLLVDIVVESVSLVDFSVDEMTMYMVDNIFEFIWKLSLGYIVLAVFDFAYQKWKHHKDMMMTKQEVKDEQKQTEGDPLIKGKIKSKQLQLSRSRMMEQVPDADVVITNPTHYAIALKYEFGSQGAPEVLAKGTDLMAKKIKEIAIENNIPIHEDPPLARALYKYCEVGEEIPAAFFKAVAQILAYIHRQKQNKKKTIV